MKRKTEEIDEYHPHHTQGTIEICEPENGTNRTEKSKKLCLRPGFSNHYDTQASRNLLINKTIGNTKNQKDIRGLSEQYIKYIVSY